MEDLTKLYNEGISYKEYVDSCEEDDRQKHLHYLKKMELTHEEMRKLSSIKADVKLLVFCNTFCNDCRITLALLENIKNTVPLVQYSIIGRERHEELMRNISGGIGIPLVLDIKNESTKVVFNEFPDTVRGKMADADSETENKLIMEFRKGLYKDEMFQQFLNCLT